MAKPRASRPPKQPAKIGRPSLFNDELAEVILDRLSEGESMVSISKDEAMPSLRTMMQWVADNPEFSHKYTRAREAQAEHMDDLIVETAKKAGLDPAAARVQVDAYKWRAAKLAPKKYGDSTMLKHADADGEKLPMDDVARATRAAALIEQALGRNRSEDD